MQKILDTTNGGKTCRLTLGMSLCLYYSNSLLPFVFTNNGCLRIQVMCTISVSSRPFVVETAIPFIGNSLEGDLLAHSWMHRRRMLEQQPGLGV